jgi:hypothetical protein
VIAAQHGSSGGRVPETVVFKVRSVHWTFVPRRIGRPYLTACRSWEEGPFRDMRRRAESGSHNVFSETL